MAKHKYTFYVTKVIYMNCKVVCTEAEGQSCPDTSLERAGSPAIKYS